MVAGRFGVDRAGSSREIAQQITDTPFERHGGSMCRMAGIRDLTEGQLERAASAAGAFDLLDDAAHECPQSVTRRLALDQIGHPGNVGRGLALNVGGDQPVL